MKLFNLKISSYITQEIISSFLAFFLVISIIIIGNQFYLVISQSLNQGIINSEIFPLIILKYSRDLAFVFNFSFSLALIYSLNKLFKNSELVVLANAGIGDKQIFKFLFPLIIIVYIFVSFLSFYLAPVSINTVNEIKDNAKLRPDYIFFKERSFQNFTNDNLIFYTSEIDSTDDNQLMKNVFISSEKDNRIILSNKGQKLINPLSGNVYLSLLDGKIYNNIFSSDLKAYISVTNFDKLDILLFQPNKSDSKKNRDSKSFISTLDLINTSNNENIKELLYRFSVPLSILIMIILSIQLSRTNPRNTRNFSLGIGVVCYIFYYNMLIFFKEIQSDTIIEMVLLSLIPHSIFLFLILIIAISRNKFFS